MKYISALFLAFTAILFSSGASAQTTATDSVKTVVIKVSNLHCDNDMPTIKKRLLNQEGIDDVAFTERADERSTFTVTYHSSATTPVAIEKAVETTPGCDDQSETPYRVEKDRAHKKKKP
jgi:copper chaperone CopZ